MKRIYFIGLIYLLAIHSYSQVVITCNWKKVTYIDGDNAIVKRDNVYYTNIIIDENKTVVLEKDNLYNYKYFIDEYEVIANESNPLYNVLKIKAYDTNGDVCSIRVDPLRKRCWIGIIKHDSYFGGFNVTENEYKIEKIFGVF